MINIGFITTSRADYGIISPLMRKIREHPEFDLYVFAGGMHTSEKFGMSFNLIERDGFTLNEKIESLKFDDSAVGIAKAMGRTTELFGAMWAGYKDILDLVFVMGDRFEMHSAALSLMPYNIKIAHLHGGETTLGAIDNKFRHSLTSISDYHFTSHEAHKKKVSEIIGSGNNVYNVGAMGIDGLLAAKLMTPLAFQESFDFNIGEPFILLTLHPETIDLNNGDKVAEVIKSLKSIPDPVLCTLPNADTEGMVIRKALLDYQEDNPDKIKCFENLGQIGYLTAMRHCKYMLGNTSSGIIEACSFNKLVINVGDRQKGRLSGDNVIHCSWEESDILGAVDNLSKIDNEDFINPYGSGNTAERIMNILTNEFLC